MLSKTQSRNGSINPLSNLKKQRAKIQDAMADLLVKCRVPAILNMDSGVTTYRWTEEKAKKQYSRLEALLVIIDGRIKENECS